MNVALWAQLQPQAPAVVATTGNRTYCELNERCNQLVRALREHGVGAGDGVALLSPNRTEFVEVFWATRRAGMRMTPINWRLTGEEAAYIANDCDAKVFIADARFQAAAEHVAANAPRAAAASRDRRRDSGIRELRGAAARSGWHRHSRPSAGKFDALHVRHDRQAERRVSLVRSADLSQPRRKRRLSSWRKHPSGHRSAVSRRAAVAIDGHSAALRCGGRADGRLG